MIDRRTFVNRMATLMAGGSALGGHSLEAWTAAVDANTPAEITGDLVRLIDITASVDGIPADRAWRLRLGRDESCLMQVTINQRALYRWVPVPEQIIIGTPERLTLSFEHLPCGGIQPYEEGCRACVTLFSVGVDGRTYAGLVFGDPNISVRLSDIDWVRASS